MKGLKTLKAARRSHNVSERTMRDSAVWAKFVRGLHCPYCTSQYFGDTGQFKKHLDRCRALEVKNADEAVWGSFKKASAYKKWEEKLLKSQGLRALP